MAIELNDNIDNKSPKILDARYSINGVTPYTTVLQANSSIPLSYRAIGLTVNIANVEYWYENGTADVDLVIKTSGGSVNNGANGLSLDGFNVVLGGTMDRDTEIAMSGYVFKFLDGVNDSFSIDPINKRYLFGDINSNALGILSNSVLIGKNYDFSGLTLNGDVIYSIGGGMTGVGDTFGVVDIGRDNNYTDTQSVISIGFTNIYTNVDGLSIIGNLNESIRVNTSFAMGDGGTYTDVSNSFLLGGNIVSNTSNLMLLGNLNALDNFTDSVLIGYSNSLTNISNRIVIGNSNKNIYIDTTTGALGINKASPTAMLHVTGIAPLASVIKIDNNSNAPLIYGYNNGNVNIGTATSSAIDRLVVVGTNATSSNFSHRVYNSALVNLMSIRNDGYTLLNGLTVGKGLSQLASNVVFGVSALNANTTGFNNFAFGFETLLSNTTGQNNVGIGHNVLRANISGNDNVAIGTQVLRFSTASQNTGIGAFSFLALTSGVQNTAIGNQSMLVSTTASLNTALGYYTLRSNVTGQRNVAIGWNALDLATNSFNVAVGYRAGGNITTGEYNTAVGNDTMATVTTGNYNTFIGRDTGRNIDTGSRNTIIGASVTGLSGSLSDTIILATGDGTIRMYSNSSSNTGFGTILPTATIHGKGIDATGSNSVMKLDNLANTNLLNIKNNGVISLNSIVGTDSQLQLATNGSVGFSFLNYTPGNQQMYFDACYEANNIIAKHTHSFSILNVGAQLRFGRANGLTPGSAFGYGIAMTVDAATGYVGVNTGTGTVTSPLQIGGVPTYLNNATAVGAGLTVGALYIRIGHGLDIVV